MSSAGCCPPWVRGVAWGWGLFWLRQSPTCSPALRGCVSLEALSTARARELWLVQVPACFPSSSWLRCRLLIRRRAGCVTLRLLLWLCSGSLSDQAAGLGCPLRCMEDCVPSVSKSIFIQNYFNIKIYLRIKPLPVACLGCQAYGWGDAGTVLRSRVAQLSSVHMVACLCLCQRY